MVSKSASSNSTRVKIGAVLTACAAAGVSFLVAPQEVEAAATNQITYRAATPGARAIPNLPVSQWPAVLRIGTTVAGRNIVATRQGNPRAQKIMLAVGVIHGNEPKGGLVVDATRAVRIPTNVDYQLWTIRSMNPDGQARNQRHNGRGVDLNRNFPFGWSKWTYAAGRGPGSEAETQSLVNFMHRLRPDASFIYHQDWNQVLGCSAKVRRYVLRYSQLSGIPPEPCRRAYTGVMGGWYNNNYPGYVLTVELPGSRSIGPRRIKQFRNSVLQTARELRNLDTKSVLPPTPSPSPTTTP